MERHFYRCLACLDVIAVEGARLMPHHDGRRDVGPYCDCGGKLDWMGRVRQNNLVRFEERCPCDSRCTCATGPNCDCSCGGANHGTKRTVTVTIVTGKAPTVNAREDLETRKARAAEFTAAKTAAIGRIDLATGGAITAANEGRRVSHENWRLKQDLLHAYAKARGFLSHKRRIAALNAIAERRPELA